MAALGLVSAIAASAASAQEMPVPKLLQGLQGEKARWQMEVLEGGGRAGKGTTITVCTDDLLRQADRARERAAKPECKHRLAKDSADEALLESECPERSRSLALKREGERILVEVQSNGPKGPQRLKLRYTRVGPC